MSVDSSVSTRRALGGLWNGLGRVSLVTMVLFAFVFAFGAFSEAADPATVERVADTMLLATVFGHDITILDPVGYVAILWSFGPIGRVCWAISTDLKHDILEDTA